MQRSFYLLLIVIGTSFSAFAQTGTIKGTLVDERTGEGIIGANVVIEGTTQGASTDISGNFVIAKVKAGKYNLVASYISYVSKTIANVEVYPDQTTVVFSSLKEDVQELETVVVAATRSTDTDISVITELRKTDMIAVGISSQMIQMSQDRDAAQAIRRIPGVTIMNNRFVNVRGLSERYSTVLLNGIIAPSTEVDSRAFAFDLIPSNLIDRMLVYKSGAPELPGEFAGADINIFTKNTVVENATSLSISGSYRFNTTGQQVSLSPEKASTDWLGFDNKVRVLPDAFPTTNLRQLSGNANDMNSVINATKMLPNTWGTRTLTPMPDLRVNFDLARTFRIGSKKLDNITSLSYARTNQKLELTQNYYDAFVPQEQKSLPRYHYDDTRFTQTSRLGLVSNFTFEFNPAHRIEFRNFFNQQGQNQSTLRTGADYPNFDINNQSFNYYARGIYSGQLSGKHSFSDAVNFNWIFGYNQTNANQPDYRRIRSQRAIDTSDPFSIVIPPGASSFDAGRFYSKLKESTYSAVGNLEFKLNPGAEEERQTKIITGYYLEQKNRSFDARWMSYKWINSGAIDLSMLQQPFSTIFSEPNLGTKFILEEGTNIGPDLYDKYKGANQLIAGYGGIVTPFAENFRLTAGLRVEDNLQQINVLEEDKKDVQVVRNPVVVPMPFLNLSYNFTPEMLVRVAYSKTVNRPVFRELAPFNYYDFDRNADIVGNPDLKTARIDNVDLRWELYPSKSESIAFGAFYKHFTDPIEQILTPGSNLRYTYVNADKANNYGIEAEVRKSLDNVTSNRILRRMTFVFNGALINSKIELPASLDNLEKDRPMQGQSPYVVNTSVFYNDIERGWQVSVMYNVFGKRIFAVGDNNGNPNQYEMPRNQIDMTLTKQLSQKFELRFGIQDILNQKYRLIQDSNRDKKITGVDESIQTYRWGQYTTLGVVMRF